MNDYTLHATKALRNANIATPISAASIEESKDCIVVLVLYHRGQYAESFPGSGGGVFDIRLKSKGPRSRNYRSCGVVYGLLGYSLCIGQGYLGIDIVIGQFRDALLLGCDITLVAGSETIEATCLGLRDAVTRGSILANNLHAIEQQRELIATLQGVVCLRSEIDTETISTVKSLNIGNLVVLIYNS